ncbi:MAG: adenylate cyclase [Pirellulaceae bacterium]|nr:MAG: adenylate cyclase [Pirellulaceae bacterium]GIW96278.1 MAG: adenylate cyclase [Pirellulaceae bacterium]
MADLIAQGTAAEHRWRRPLVEGQTVIIGRASGSWETPWDTHISRRHAEIRWEDGQLHVRMLPEARNPIFYRGKTQTAFSLHPGEHFVIGSTTFTLTESRAAVSLTHPAPVTEQVFPFEVVRHQRFHASDQKLEVLSHLPSVIEGASSDSELFVRLVNLLLAGVPEAVAVALVAVRPEQEGGAIQILHWDRRGVVHGDFMPSERLIRQAVARQQTVLHVWRDPASEAAEPYTQTEGVDWAFCTPVRGECCQGWAIYVAGRRRLDRPALHDSDPSGVRDDVKFTELAATTLANLRKLRMLEQRQAGLRSFFSPIVLEALAGQDPEVALAPREAEVTVMFCDLRGFSLHAEQASHDLFGLLRRVSRALGIVTHQILEQSGVVGDFHGDAAMGFWGWPLDQADAVQRAAHAALAIRRQFVQLREEDSELANFRVGIGIATGRAVAGKIGTVDQVKVTAFGPVVNLASRLESMTRLLQAEILVDETTASQLRKTLVPAAARLRRVARLRPYGMLSPVVVNELLPPAGDPFPSPLSDEDITTYEAALKALEQGRWDEAFRLLHGVPAEDRVKDFLTVLIARHGRTPPENWDGTIYLDSK